VPGFHVIGCSGQVGPTDGFEWIWPTFRDRSEAPGAMACQDDARDFPRDLGYPRHISLMCRSTI
jgi:hypothetical protein